jgi:hypothetical protein
MFVFNTTFVVAQHKFINWHQWLKNSYMPMLKNLIPASEVNAYEVMTADSKDEKTVSIQWKVTTPTELEIINRQSPVILGQMSSEFGQDALYFSTILKDL